MPVFCLWDNRSVVSWQVFLSAGITIIQTLQAQRRYLCVWYFEQQYLTVIYDVNHPIMIGALPALPNCDIAEMEKNVSHWPIVSKLARN